MKGEKVSSFFLSCYYSVFPCWDWLLPPTFQMYISGSSSGFILLLIGFYYERATAVAASKKALSLQGLLIWVFWSVSWFCHSHRNFWFYTLTDPKGPALLQGSGVLFLGLSTIGRWSSFHGRAGKSAMFPLHIGCPMQWKARRRSLHWSMQLRWSLRGLPGCQDVFQSLSCLLLQRWRS